MRLSQRTSHLTTCGPGPHELNASPIVSSESVAAVSPRARAAETAATALVYLVSGPSEFVDVSYELAVGNVNIHVLTTLAVAGTVFLGCALEGALLLVLFSSAAFVEMRLTGHARGDLRSLWATVPGEAVLVDVDAQPRVQRAHHVRLRQPVREHG